ncbi:MAG: CoB--CoM heterodisulfide reductase iron-sulfur subunit A family protein [Dehalococcoidales bacterium]|nr:CoB--CoM heterodisulfide reductase iron-sulfur subunit A family protein [Dehalococcoidales bacterium]
MVQRRLGVFICYCGGNISDYVDVEKVRDAVENEPSVVIAETNMFTCSDAAQQEIINEIRNQKLDGIVIASCSPKLHLNTFRAMVERAGLNPYQYTQVNIREQCSWTHTHNRDAATEKAIRLVRSGIATTGLSKPLQKLRIETTPETLVIGAGVAGLRAAIALSDLGITVHIIERTQQTGGTIGKLGKMFPDNKDGSDIIKSLMDEIRHRENISIFTNAEIIEKSGNVGSFTVKVRVNNTNILSLNVGSIIVATGFESYTPVEGEFGFGLDGVITLTEYKELLSRSPDGLKYKGRDINTVTYIYCVGSREQSKQENPNLYCSRYCCSAAVHAALCTDELDAGIHQFHLFRDIRTYGKYETMYIQALNQNSVFLRYDEVEPPRVIADDGKLEVRIYDHLTGGEEIEIDSDLVVLATGMIPRENTELINVLKLPVGKDGFFNEIHPKLRPVETVIDGIFIAGAAQSPKTLAESVASSMAAVSKSAALLLKGYVDLEPLVAKVNPELCIWCGECMETCPYGAVQRTKADGKEIAEVNAILCKGEGACVPVCPQQAIDIEGYTNQQIRSMIDALVNEVA